MTITNNPTIENECVNGLRNISERRAATIALMIEEAKELGLDESFARRAIYRYGIPMGKDFYNMLEDPTDIEELAKYFGKDHNWDIYEMETVASTEDKLYIDFHYCPYVAQWLKMGIPEDEIAELCDITMEGDRAIGDCFPAINFTLGKTIAQGHTVCQLRFDKVKVEEADQKE